MFVIMQRYTFAGRITRFYTIYFLFVNGRVVKKGIGFMMNPIPFLVMIGKYY